MFRKEAVDQFSSGELLDRNLEVIKSKSWMILAVLVVVMLTAAIWGFFGEIPRQQEGVGILVSKNSPLRLASPSSTGMVQACNVKPGDVVRQGTALMEIGSPADLTMLNEARRRLDSALQQDGLDNTSEDASLESLRASLDMQIKASNGLIAEAEQQLETALVQDEQNRSIEERSLEKLRASLDLQIGASEAALEQTSTLITIYKEQAAKYRDLVEERAIPEVQLINLQVKLFEAEQLEKTAVARIAGYESEYENRASMIELARSDRQARIETLKSSILQVRTATMANRSELESSLQNRITAVEIARSNRKLRIEEARSGLAEATSRHTLNATIVAPFEIEIVDVMVHEGDYVSRGMDVITALRVLPAGSVENRENQDDQVVGFVNFHLGMDIEPGMPVQVAIPFAESTRYGFVKGVIEKVATYTSDRAAVAQQVGSESLAALIDQSTGNVPLMIEVALEHDDTTPSGFAWTTGSGFPEVIPDLSVVAFKVTTRYERPVDMVLPWFKTLLGIDVRPVSLEHLDS